MRTSCAASLGSHETSDVFSAFGENSADRLFLLSHSNQQMSIGQLEQLTEEQAQNLMKSFIKSLIDEHQVDESNCRDPLIRTTNITKFINQYKSTHKLPFRVRLIIMYREIINSIFPCKESTNDTLDSKVEKDDNDDECTRMTRKRRAIKKRCLDNGDSKLVLVIDELTKAYNVDIVNVSAGDIINAIESFESRIDTLTSNASSNTIDELIKDMILTNKHKIITNSQLSNLIEKLDNKRYEYTPPQNEDASNSQNELGNKLEDDFQNKFDKWCDKMYVIEELNKDEIKTDTHKLHEIYQIMVAPIDYNIFVQQLQQYLRFNAVNSDEDKIKFTTAFKSLYPLADDKQLEDISFDNCELISADGWGTSPVINVGLVGIGEYGCLESSCDHYCWGPIMEDNTDWQCDIGSSTFINVSYENLFPRSLDITYKSMLVSAVEGYDDLLVHISNSQTINEFKYWHQRLVHRCALNSDTFPRLPLSRLGGLNWRTQTECEHGIRLMSLYFRLRRFIDNDVEDIDTKYGHVRYHQLSDDEYDSSDDEDDDKHKHSWNRNILTVSKRDYKYINKVYIVDAPNSKHKSFVEYNDEDEIDVSHVGCSIYVEAETPDDWNYFVAASEPKWKRNDEARPKNKFTINSPYEFVPNITYLSGINLINLELVDKYISLTGSNNIPDWIWIEFDPNEDN